MSLSDDIRRVRGLIRTRSDKWLQGLFLEAHRRVVLKTPVKTGRARANWQPTIGEASSEVDEGEFDQTGYATIAEGAGVAKGLKFGDVAFTVNNLPYINRLEHGWSQQAPAGMVAVTVAELQGVSEGIISEIEQGKR